jgi:hypothetical protein
VLVVAVGVVDADVHARPAGVALRQDDGAVVEEELRAMVPDPEAHLEGERVAKPVGRLGDVGVRQHGDDRRGRNGTVRDHGATVH